jgi:hypothetical protein
MDLPPTPVLFFSVPGVIMHALWVLLMPRCLLACPGWWLISSSAPPLDFAVSTWRAGSRPAVISDSRLTPSRWQVIRAKQTNKPVLK